MAEAGLPATQYSPDGRWWWNGETWLPAPPTSEPGTGDRNLGGGGVGLGTARVQHEDHWLGTGIGELRRRSVVAQILFATIVTVLGIAVLGAILNR